MWSNPELYRKFRNHNITKDTFTENIWYYYYKLGQLMYDNGVRRFDEETVISFLDSRKNVSKELINKYNKYGGYETIGYLKDFCHEDKGNEEYHLNEVLKYEALRKFYKEGFINKENKELINKLVKMTLKQIQIYFNHKFKDAFWNVNYGQVEIYDLIDEDLYQTIEDNLHST